MLEQRERIWKNSQHRCTTTTSTLNCTFHCANVFIALCTCIQCIVHNVKYQESAQVLQQHRALSILNSACKVVCFDILDPNAWQRSFGGQLGEDC